MGNSRHPLVAVNDRGYVIGEGHHRAKLADSDIDLILELHALGLGYAQIAAKFDDLPGGIAKSTVRRVCKGQARGQVAHGAKRAGPRAPRFWPADPDEFDQCT